MPSHKVVFLTNRIQALHLWIITILDKIICSVFMVVVEKIKTMCYLVDRK